MPARKKRALSTKKNYPLPIAPPAPAPEAAQAVSAQNFRLLVIVGVVIVAGIGIYLMSSGPKDDRGMVQQLLNDQCSALKSGNADRFAGTMDVCLNQGSSECKTVKAALSLVLGMLKNAVKECRAELVDFEKTDGSATGTVSITIRVELPILGSDTKTTTDTVQFVKTGGRWYQKYGGSSLLG